MTRPGQDHPLAKLTNHEVELIRQLAEGGMPQTQIAAKFGISKSQVSKIVHYTIRAAAPQ